MNARRVMRGGEELGREREKTNGRVSVQLEVRGTSTDA